MYVKILRMGLFSKLNFKVLIFSGFIDKFYKYLVWKINVINVNESEFRRFGDLFMINYASRRKEYLFLW